MGTCSRTLRHSRNRRSVPVTCTGLTGRGSAAAPRGGRGQAAGAARATPALARATATPRTRAGAALTLAAATAAAAVLAAAALTGRTTPATPTAPAAAPALQARLVDGRLGPARLVGLDAFAGGELDEHRARGRHRLVAHGPDAGLAHQVADVAPLLRRLHGDDGAGLAGTGGAARAVQVRLVLDGRIGVDHQGHLVHVDAAGGDVGAHHRRRGAGAEGLEVPRAGVLGEVAVQVHRVHAAGG